MIAKYGIYAAIFAENVSSICKSYSHFLSKNTCWLDSVLTRTVNILTTNELVKLTALWTTGPRCFSKYLVEWQTVLTLIKSNLIWIPAVCLYHFVWNLIYDIYHIPVEVDPLASIHPSFWTSIHSSNQPAIHPSVFLDIHSSTFSKYSSGWIPPSGLGGDCVTDRWTDDRHTENSVALTHPYHEGNDVANFITKTCLYNFDSLKPHFYVVKLGFTGV